MTSDYTKQTWVDKSSATPVDAARLLHVEDGVADHRHLTDGEPTAALVGATVDLVPDAATVTVTWGAGDVDPVGMQAGAWHKVMDWTPTATMDLYVPAPSYDGVSSEIDYVIMTPATIADWGVLDAYYSTGTPNSYNAASFNATSGTTYGVWVYNADGASAVGRSVDVAPFLAAIEPAGGVVPAVQWTLTYTNFSRSEGVATVTEGYAAHAEGAGTNAAGAASHAEGYGTRSVGRFSHAEGTTNQAAGEASHAEGAMNWVTGDSAHVEGQENQASGNQSHVEGRYNVVTGWYGHAEGSNGNNIADWAHTEGYFCSNTAIATHSHAQGAHAVARFESQHAHAGGTLGGVEGTGQYVRQPIGPIQTTNATQTTLYSGGSGITVEPGRTYAVDGRVVARRSDVVGTNSSWTLKALVEITSGGTLRLVGSSSTVDFQDAAASTWAAIFAVDSKLRIKVTGEASKTIDWTGVMKWVEVA